MYSKYFWYAKDSDQGMYVHLYYNYDEEVSTFFLWFESCKNISVHLLYHTRSSRHLNFLMGPGLAQVKEVLVKSLV